MATTFGTEPEDVVTDLAGNVLEGVRIELYKTRSDATNSTDLQGFAVSNSVGLWPYSDDLNRSDLFARDPAGRVWPVECEGGAPVLVGLAGLPAGAVFTVYWNGADWTYNDAVITTRPSARADLTMIAVGGAAGPGFGQVGKDLWLRDA